MILLYSKIIGRKIYELAEQQYIGNIADLVIEENKPQVAALWVLDRFIGALGKKSKIISSDNVASFDDNLVYIQNEESVLGLEESPRIKNLIDQKLLGVGQDVITKSGKKLGRLVDYLIESETLAITKIYIKSLLSEKIISAKLIDKISDGKIVVKDKLENVRYVFENKHSPATN